MNEEKLVKFVKLISSIDFKSFVTKNDMGSFAKELVTSIKFLENNTIKISDETKKELQNEYRSFSSSLENKIISLRESITNENKNELKELLLLLNDTKTLADKLGKIEIKNGIDGKDGADGKNGIDGKDGASVSAQDVIATLNEEDGILPVKSVKGLPEFIKHVASLPIQKGDSSNPVALFQGGSLIKSNASKINFTGATLTQSGDTTNIAISGGGASTFTSLTDVPSSYISQSLKGVRVNSGETGLEFFTLGGGTGTVTSVASVDGSVTVTNPSTTPDLAVVKAPKLTTARTIAGVSFDGTTNIAIDHTGLTSIGTNTHAQIDTALTRLVNTSGTNTGDQTLVGLGGVASNTAITGGTNTKITYDSKGLVTAGSASTTADIAPSTNKNYVTDAQSIVIGNTSGTNTGDNAVNSLYSGLVTNATHTGDATGATVLTVKGINGTLLSGLSTGILKNTTTTGVPSIAVNTDLPVMTATQSGAVPTPPNNTTTFLRGDGTFATPTASATITTQDEGSTLSTTVTTLNFTGAGVTASGSGATTTVNIPGGSGSFTLATAEVDLGSTPRMSGNFTITTSGLTAGKAVSIQQSVGPYTGKGTLADEAEMDQIMVSASTTSTTTIVGYWIASSFIKGNFKFDYVVSA